MINKKKILVIDDEHIIRDSFSLLFKQKGYHIDTAKDGYEALEFIKRTDYCFIFIDVKMEGLDGIETLKRIKEINPEVTTVYMTAYASEDEIAQSLQTGVDGVLYKPFNPILIAEKLTQNDVLSNYECYFSSLWDRCLDILGEQTFMHVVNKTLTAVMKNHKNIVEHITADVEGISFKKLKEYLGDERPVELKTALRSLMTEICFNVENFTDHIITKEIAKDIDSWIKS